MTLADAREKARGWLKLIEKGIDPKADEERKQLKERARRKNTFAAVVEDFIAEKLPKSAAGRTPSVIFGMSLSPSGAVGRSLKSRISIFSEP